MCLSDDPKINIQVTHSSRACQSHIYPTSISVVQMCRTFTVTNLLITTWLMPVNTLVKPLSPDLLLQWHTWISVLREKCSRLNCVVKERSFLEMFSTSQAFTELEPFLGSETKLDPMRIWLKRYTLSHYNIPLYDYTTSTSMDYSCGIWQLPEWYPQLQHKTVPQFHSNKNKWTTTKPDDNMACFLSNTSVHLL